MAELIAFYSRAGENHVDGETKYLETGNTKIAAGIIQKITGADMVEIVPERLIRLYIRNVWQRQ